MKKNARGRAYPVARGRVVEAPDGVEKLKERDPIAILPPMVMGKGILRVPGSGMFSMISVKTLCLLTIEVKRLGSVVNGKPPSIISSSTYGATIARLIRGFGGGIRVKIRFAFALTWYTVTNLSLMFSSVISDM